MMWFTGSLVLLLVEVCMSQVHLGPVGDLQEVECYTCENHGINIFPECLKHTHVCHHDEVCKVVYGQGLPEMRCQKAVDCERETANPMRDCTGGGVEVSPNKCEKCCDTTACVSDIVQLIKGDIGSSDNLMCPGQCPQNDLQRCVDHSKMCGLNQFCQVTQEHGTVLGECKDNHELHHCNDEMNHHACDGNTVPHGHHGHDKCYWDCCTTSNCLSAHFGAYMSTAAPTAPTTPTAAATTPVPTVQGETLWERLKGDCKDQLAGDQCKQLIGTQDVCHDRLALSICPESCGLCDAFNGSMCADTVLNDGCQNLLTHENVCSDKLALFICPRTCNMCTELINSIVTSLLGPGESNSTDVPPSLLPPSADPSSYPTFNCEDLNGVSCGTLDSLCNTSLVNVVCPDKCKVCTAPTAPSTPTAAATTPVPTVQGETLWERLKGDCKDQVTGDQCKQLIGTQDVCHDRLALSICPDSCGLCDAFNGSVCADTVPNNGCQTLMIHENVCSDKTLAVFTCPRTCNMCTELINSVVTSLLGPGESNSTDVLPSLLPPSADPSSFPTFDCEDLNEVGCGTLDSLCNTSLVNVVCPDKCKVCTDPIPTATVNFNMTTTAADPIPTATVNFNMTTTAAPAPTTAMPAATTPDMMMNITMPAATAAPATGAPAGSTTMMMTNGPTDTTAPLCADHLTGMNCSQLNDVCASVMALSVCPKYCGLCSSP